MKHPILALALIVFVSSITLASSGKDVDFPSNPSPNVLAAINQDKQSNVGGDLTANSTGATLSVDDVRNGSMNSTVFVILGLLTAAL